MKWGKGSHVINKLMAHCLPKVGGYTTAPGKNILMYPDCHLAVTNYIICPHVAVLKLIRPYNFAKIQNKEHTFVYHSFAPIGQTQPTWCGLDLQKYWLKCFLDTTAVIHASKQYQFPVSTRPLYLLEPHIFSWQRSYFGCKHCGFHCDIKLRMR